MKSKKQTGLIANVTMKIVIPLEEADCQCDAEHYVLTKITHIIKTGNNADEIFEKLQMHIEYSDK